MTLINRSALSPDKDWGSALPFMCLMSIKGSAEVRSQSELLRPLPVGTEKTGSAKAADLRNPHPPNVVYPADATTASALAQLRMVEPNFPEDEVAVAAMVIQADTLAFPAEVRGHSHPGHFGHSDYTSSAPPLRQEFFTHMDQPCQFGCPLQLILLFLL